MQWTVKEQKLMEKYFTTQMRELTLFNNLRKINPSRTYEAMTRRLRLMRADGWEKDKTKALKSLRVGYLDIEASNLNANFGVMLTWYIKTQGKNEYHYSIVTKKELFNGTMDKRITKELLEAMQNYDVIYTHWGKDRRYDIPFIRTKAFMHNMEDMLPKYMEQFIMDTWDIAKNKLKCYNNRLETIAITLGINNVKKTPITGPHWMKATYGDPEALEYVATHNKRDVQLLERVHKRLECIETASLRSM